MADSKEQVVKLEKRIEELQQIIDTKKVTEDSLKEKMTKRAESHQELIEDVSEKLDKIVKLDENADEDSVGTNKKDANNALAIIDKWENEAKGSLPTKKNKPQKP